MEIPRTAAALGGGGTLVEPGAAMHRTDEELDRSPRTATAQGRWAGVRTTVRAHRVVTAVTGVALVVVVAVTVAVLLFAQPTTPDVAIVGPPSGENDSAPAVDDDVPEPAPAPQPGAEPAEPVPAGDPPSGEPAPGPEPARIEVREQRLYLVDADGQVLRTLRDAHDGSQEYTLRHVMLRPGSTTRDLAVTFVEGYMTGALQVLTVADGGEPVITHLATVDYELHDQQPMALPAGVWSPDGDVLAWLEPDAANRAVLRAVRWSASGLSGQVTPAAGIPVDPEGLMAADETRGLELVTWEPAPSEHLTAHAYRPFDEGAERHYTIGLQRDGGQLQAQTLARS